MIYDLVKSSDPILRQELKTFDFNSPEIDPVELSNNLIETMHHYKGVGLAANQCGLPYRVFVMKSDPNFVCFNPKIVMPSEEEIVLEEGCLSYPGITVKVKRPKHIRARFTTPSGQTTTKTFTGMSARIFQHEMMHLEGKTFRNFVSRLNLEMAIKKAKKRGFNYLISSF